MRTIWILLALFLLSACGAQGASTNAAPTPEATIEATIPSAPFDALFIDSLAAHQQTAVVMAQRALTEGEHEELTTLAQTIIDTYGAQIAQLLDWRVAWYPTIELTGGIPTNLGAISIAEDADQPFDFRFINALLAHHQVTIEFARSGQANAEHDELRQLCGDIINEHEDNITQLGAWQAEWYPSSG